MLGAIGGGNASKSNDASSCASSRKGEVKDIRSFESLLTLFDFGGGVRTVVRGDAARTEERGEEEEASGGRADPFVGEMIARGGIGRNPAFFGVASTGGAEVEASDASLSLVGAMAAAAAFAAINSLIDGLVTFAPAVDPTPPVTPSDTFFPGAALSRAFLVDTSNPTNILSVIFGQISLEAQNAARIFSLTIGFGSTNPFLMHNSNKSTPPELSTKAKDFFVP